MDITVTKSCLLPLLVVLTVSCSFSCATENTPNDGDTDLETETLPQGLPFEYTRPDVGEPLTDQEQEAFSGKMRRFFEQVQYFDWLLRMSHGMDDSTGLRDYMLWWTDTHAVKQGDTVTIVHNYSEQHGGHNILKGNSIVLSSAIGGYLLTGDAAMAELAQQYCKGISSTMLGMVHDENDTILHLMARNVISSNHAYTTHDGHRVGEKITSHFQSGRIV